LKLIILTIINQNHSGSILLSKILENFNLNNANIYFTELPNSFHKLMIAIYHIYKTLYKNYKDQKNNFFNVFAERVFIWTNIVDFFVKQLNQLNSSIMNAKNEEIVKFLTENINLDVLQTSLKLINLENFILGKTLKFDMQFSLHNMNILQNSSIKIEKF
jgi:hypothetical protein